MYSYNLYAFANSMNINKKRIHSEEKKRNVKNTHLNIQRQPVTFVAIGYDDVYDDFNEVNPLKLLDGIPTEVVLKFVAEKYSSIFYAQSDVIAQRRHIRDFCPYLPLPKRKKTWNFIKNIEASGNHVFLYSAMGCMMTYRLALQSYCPLEQGDDSDICMDEFEPIFKALLYCNKIWTDQQLSKDKHPLSDILLKMDIPIVESKHYKDFRPQLYKANQFFTFCENDSIFNSYLSFFVQDKNVRNWGDYVVLLFNIYSYSINNCILPHGNANEQQFLSQYVIDPKNDNVRVIWDKGTEGMKYLRDHFLYAMSDGNFLLLDANLLIDKIYQGLKFELYKTIQAHGLSNARGKPYNGLPDFNSTLGEVFSEKHLLYELIGKIYNGSNAICFTGDELKQTGITGEPDFYLRVEDTLFLIEYKDLLFPDKLRYSNNVDDIKIGILNRLCKDDDINHRKGGGQLLYNIDRILNRELFDKIDEGVKYVRHIFPLIITTDRAFSAMGVNLTVIEEFNNIRQRKYVFKQSVMIYVPVIMNIDSLISLSYRLHTSKLQLSNLLLDYIMCNWKNMSSFDNYVFDKCKESEKDRAAAIEYLLGPIVAKVASMTGV